MAFHVLDIAETCGIRIADREIAFKGGSADELNNNEFDREFSIWGFKEANLKEANLSEL